MNLLLAPHHYAMTDETDKDLPSDAELGEMLKNIEGGKRKKRDLTEPSPRFPEAFYYYLFILIESVILIGVWGFMRMGVDEALAAPGFDEPITEQFIFHLKSIFVGFADVLTAQAWIVLGVCLLGVGVFMPKTPKSRKRMASFISTALVVIFVLLIALQFNEDLQNASSTVGM